MLGTSRLMVGRLSQLHLFEFIQVDHRRDLGVTLGNRFELLIVDLKQLLTVIMEEQLIGT